MSSQQAYYVPETAKWPIVGCLALFAMGIGAATWLNGSGSGSMLLLVGFVMLLTMIFGWFSDVCAEGEKGLYNNDVDASFRWGMIWFIFSEVMFFAAFFGALYYARVFSVEWLGGHASGQATWEFLWPQFQANWPLVTFPDNTYMTPPKAIVEAGGIPAINTLLLLTSGVTLTFAHHALKHDNRGGLVKWLAATVALGAVFLMFQMQEYGHAIHDLDLTLNSGIYGSTFYMLTGFHGFHVTMGAIMLTVILIRSMRGHYTPKKHFAFEAVAWYWHFVDVVWLGLFIFVYWI